MDITRYMKTTAKDAAPRVNMIGPSMCDYYYYYDDDDS